MTGVDIRGPAADGRRILEPGKNCWRVEPGSRGAVLIDGASYFGALRAAFLNARRSILILGWDIDSRLGLVGVAHDDDLPVGLSDFLNALTARRPELRVRVLSWDFAMIYAMEREWLSAYRLGWMTGSGVDFRLDDRHPVGASHHQKIAVIDDRLAFVGGIDLSKWRWDTPDHDPGDPRRKDADGNPYPPFHDLQWMVEGEVAAAVGELARERWRRATDQAIEPSADDLPSPWPDGVDADFVDCPIAIARTDPELGGRPAVREVERLYVDAVRQARNFIYVENQYLTCAAVADVLAERLREPDAPETVIVLPLKTGGWLEQYTMDVLRARLLRGLREADRHDRLRVYYPHVPGLEPDTCLGLHSKLMIVDDRLLRFGSANLSNRSMGLDTECDLAFEAADAAGRRFVSGVLTRLVAEHLGSTESEASKVLEEEGSLIAAIERLSGSGRSLRPLEADVDEDVDRLVPDAALL
ncbi:MAG: phospholipase D-like domain-containing protein, partial [Chromatiales bacterium]